MYPYNSRINRSQQTQPQAQQQTQSQTQPHKSPYPAPQYTPSTNATQYPNIANPTQYAQHTHNEPDTTPDTTPPTNEDNSDYSELNKYVVGMLLEAILDEKVDAKYYDTIANMLTNEEDKKVFHKIHHDEEKHKKIFTEIYEIVTGNPPSEEDLIVEEKPVSDNMLENFSKSIFEELGAVEFYRKIYFSFLNTEIRDALFEIMTDEQSHAQILNYMYSKYQNM